MMVALMVTPSFGGGTEYFVRIDSADWAGSNAILSFEYTNANGISSNSVLIKDLTHDGIAGISEALGGPVDTDLYHENPADTTLIEDSYEQFFNALSVSFDSLGSEITFSFIVDDDTTGQSGIIDEFAFYWIGGFNQHYFDTSDPLGSNALFAVTVTGESGGELTVFDPMEFIAPDSLVFDASDVTGIGDDKKIGRFRILSLAPNPLRNNLEVRYEVPEPGMEIGARVFDVQGRLVSEVASEFKQPGTWSMRWQGNDRTGRRVGSGVYFFMLKSERQTTVRKVVVVR
jgi:hypothetical protein